MAGLNGIGCIAIGSAGAASIAEQGDIFLLQGKFFTQKAVFDKAGSAAACFDKIKPGQAVFDKIRPVAISVIIEGH